jgi:hypothetical protein
MRRRQTRARDHDVTYRDRASVDVRVRAADHDPQVARTRLLPPRPRCGLPAYRPAVRRARPERDRPAADPHALAGPDADRDLDPRGHLCSTVLLRRLSSESRRNNLYKALRELGRASCTITLLRLISEPELRAQIDAATKLGRVLQQLLRLARVWRRAARAQRPRRAGEDPPSAPGSMTTSPPTHRPSFATTLVRGGTGLVIAAELLGHARLETTRVCPRPTAEDRSNAIALLPVDE